MNKNLLVLLVAALLIVFGLFKPSLSVVDPANNENFVSRFKPPSNVMLADYCMPVIEALRSNPSSRNVDGKKLASLYRDLATLISLDGDNMVIKNTEEVRQANRLAGIMLQLDMKGKYKDLASANDTLIKVAIGDDSVLLDSILRDKAVEGFNALAWACYEGSK